MAKTKKEKNRNTAEGTTAANNTNIYILDMEAAHIKNPSWYYESEQLDLQHTKKMLESLIDGTNNSKNLELFSVSLDEAISENANNTAPEHFTITEEYRSHLYAGTIPVSLDMLKLHREAEGVFYTYTKKTGKTPYEGELLNRAGIGKLYTDAIINVSFDRALYDMADEVKQINALKNGKINLKFSNKGKKTESTKDLRDDFYEKGFTISIDGVPVKYVKYKRSASKARKGSHLFIKADLADVMNDWDTFGVKFVKGEDANITAIKAYESLTLSGIEDTVNIHPSQILLIKDVEVDVWIKASVTKVKDGILKPLDEDNYKITNIVWDGQSLADESLFKPGENNKTKGMMLLRNSFFKSCAFNTKIQDWFNYAFKGNPPEYLKDMFGREVKTSDIKLITTPSSLKFLKFVDKIVGIADISNEERERHCYEMWLANVPEVFGICKNESESPFGEAHQLSYQMVNSLPLERHEVGTVTKNADGSLIYGGLIQDDFMHIERMKNDMDYFFENYKPKDPQPADICIAKLLEVRPELWNTRLVKEYVKNKVDGYIKNLREGRIKVEGSDYAVLIGNPFEMLQYAAFEDRENGTPKGKPRILSQPLHRPLTDKEICCSMFEDGEELAGFRNPHITMGNVLFVTNVHKKEFSDYFNLTDNIVISNAWDSDIMERLQGQDYDSDTVLLTSNTTLLKAARACQSDEFRVPINGVKDETILRPFTDLMESECDYITAQSKLNIGMVVNLSQILNSYYWEYRADGKPAEVLKELYSEISILSSLSQMEIDRAKKDYKVDAAGHLRGLKNDPIFEYVDKEVDKKELDDDELMEWFNHYLTLNQLRTFRDYDKIIPKLEREREKFMSGMTLDEKDAEYYDLYSRFETAQYYNRPEEEIAKLEQELILLIDSGVPHKKEMDMLYNLDYALKEARFCQESEENKEKATETINETKQKLVDLLSKGERNAQVRPMFLKYCSEYESGGNYKYRLFRTPMDYLQEFIDNYTPRKDYSRDAKIGALIDRPIMEKANRRHVPDILEACKKANEYIESQKTKPHIAKDIRETRIRIKMDELIEMIKDTKVNEVTIATMIYRAFSKEGDKDYSEKYADIKRLLVTCLYMAHPDITLKVLGTAKKSPASTKSK